MNFGLFCSLLFPQCLKRCREHSGRLINEWIPACPRRAPTPAQSLHARARTNIHTFVNIQAHRLPRPRIPFLELGSFRLSQALPDSLMPRWVPV